MRVRLKQFSEGWAICVPEWNWFIRRWYPISEIRYKKNGCSWTKNNPKFFDSPEDALRAVADEPQFVTFLNLDVEWRFSG